jgi:hypothetical protein
MVSIAVQIVRTDRRHGDYVIILFYSETSMNIDKAIAKEGTLEITVHGSIKACNLKTRPSGAIRPTASLLTYRHISGSILGRGLKEELPRTIFRWSVELKGCRANDSLSWLSIKLGTQNCRS